MSSKEEFKVIIIRLSIIVLLFIFISFFIMNPSKFSWIPRNTLNNLVICGPQYFTTGTGHFSSIQNMLIFVIFLPIPLYIFLICPRSNCFRRKCLKVNFCIYYSSSIHLYLILIYSVGIFYLSFYWSTFIIIKHSEKEFAIICPHSESTVGIFGEYFSPPIHLLFSEFNSSSIPSLCFESFKRVDELMKICPIHGYLIEEFEFYKKKPFSLSTCSVENNQPFLEICNSNYRLLYPLTFIYLGFVSCILISMCIGVCNNIEYCRNEENYKYTLFGVRLEEYHICRCFKMRSYFEMISELSGYYNNPDIPSEYLKRDTGKDNLCNWEVSPV
jgi:hypothetical protein